MLMSPGSLLVTFSRQGENEEVQIALTGENALTAALVMLILRDELRAEIASRYGRTGWRIFSDGGVGSPSATGLALQGVSRVRQTQTGSGTNGNGAFHLPAVKS